MFELFSGFASGTSVVEGPQFANCSASVQKYVDVYEEILQDYENILAEWAQYGIRNSFDLWPFLLINDKYIWLLHNFYEVSKGCYYGGFEAYLSLSDFAEWMYDPWIIVRNSINNYGFIYTNVRDLYYMLRRDIRTPI
jgi:hypothetical protein